MSETTLQVKTRTDVAALREYARALDDVRKAAAAAKGELGTLRPGAAAPGAAGGAAGPPPAPPTGGQPGAPPNSGKRGARGFSVDEKDWFGAGDYMSGKNQQMSMPAMPSMPGVGAGALGAVRTGETFLGRVASTAIGVGLGSSLFELPFKAAQTYFEVSRIVAQLGARFRETGNDANYFAGRLGYTIAQSAQFAEAYGQGMDRFSRQGFMSSVGAARAMGSDPGHMAGVMGMLGRLRGNNALNDNQIVKILGLATSQGTSRGRLDEFLGAYQRLSEHQFRIAGRADAMGPRAAFALSGATFGPTIGPDGKATYDPRAQGETAADFAERFNGVMTGEGPMRTFMMRAIGFGATNGPGYIAMRKQLEKGVFDSSNVTALFGSMQKMGLGRGGMFRALESVAGGKLTAEEIDSLVTKLGTPEGLTQYRTMAAGASKDKEAFLSGLSENERAAFEKTGLVGLGQTKVSAGEGRAVELEAMQLAIGRPIAESIGNLTDAAKNVMDTLAMLFGDSPGKVLIEMSEGIKDVSKMIKEVVGSTTSARELGASAVYHDPITAYKAGIGMAGSALYGGSFYGNMADESLSSLAFQAQSRAAGVQK